MPKSKRLRHCILANSPVTLKVASEQKTRCNVKHNIQAIELIEKIQFITLRNSAFFLTFYTYPENCLYTLAMH